ncbi:transporter bos1 [Ascosphaera apis ARSEF 7405]|uniref:Transporter bos1 n=1 Tax=Ascosphaera apis ARSEF 7405 TaxID=392613 RepID=A0A167UVB7_9EURO|nr:transporter bos1 [Ascosphaera apis ARSEF 7405]
MSSSPTEKSYAEVTAEGELQTPAEAMPPPPITIENRTPLPNDNITDPSSPGSKVTSIHPDPSAPSAPAAPSVGKPTPVPKDPNFDDAVVPPPSSSKTPHSINHSSGCCAKLAKAACGANALAMLGVAGVAGWAGWRKHVRGELNGQVAGCIVGGVALNSLFNAALKQSAAVRRDLDTFAEQPASFSPALMGQLSASLTSFSRTIDDYNQLSKKEIIPAKQEKAYERIKNFRAELAEYRSQFDRLKKEREDALASSSRTELLGRRPHNTITPENPYATTTASSQQQQAQQQQPSIWSRPGGPTAQSLSFTGSLSPDYARESHALRESSFLRQTSSQIDEYLERGRAVLGDLHQQREILKGTQRRLYSVGNTLGISGDTIRRIERRVKGDKAVFWGGCVVFAGFVWVCLHYLR